MRDVTLAIVDFLKADSAVQAMVGDSVDGYRVFGEELPGAQAASMPRKCVVIRRVSGTGGRGGSIELERGAVSVACFGETPLDAQSLRQTVANSLKYLFREVVAGTLLHSLEPLDSPASYRDPDMTWPYAVMSYQFLASEVQAA